MSEATQALARTLLGLPGAKGGGDLAMGKVLSVRPLRVLAEGTTQDEDALLKCDGMDPAAWRVGDMLALWPIEEHQRYVILGKVIEV